MEHIDENEVLGYGMSVDDIISEFGGYQPSGSSDEEAVAPAPAPEAETAPVVELETPDEDDVRIYSAPEKAERASDSYYADDDYEEPDEIKIASWPRGGEQKRKSIREMREEALHARDMLSGGIIDLTRGEGNSAGPMNSEQDFGFADLTLDEDSFDERYNMSGRNSSMSYNGREIDTSADEDYVYHAPSEDSPMHWAGESEEEEDDTPVETKKKPALPKLRAFSRRDAMRERKRRASAPPAVEDDELEYAEAERREDLDYEINDNAADNAEYAENRDYSDSEHDDGKPDIADAAPPRPSILEYITTTAASLLYRMRGFGGNSVYTDDGDEDLGPEMSCTRASKYYGSHVRAMRLRTRLCIAIIFLMSYMSIGLPVPGMLKDLHTASHLLLAEQLLVMLICLDQVTSGILSIFRKRPGAEALAVISCVLTGIDALLSAHGVVTPHMPLCALSSMSLAGVLLSALLSARGLRKALRVPAIGKVNYAVTAEGGVKGVGITLLKSVRPTTGFVRRSEESAPDEDAFIKAFPYILALSFVLSVVVVIAKREFSGFIYVLSAILAPGVPVTALMCFALPFFAGSMRIFSSGAAIAGWSGICDIGTSRDLVITDRDLFPDGSVEIESIRIFADEEPEKIIAYAGSMLVASGSSVAGCFGELMEKNGCTMQHIDNFEYLSGGGMKGMIDGHSVLCGGVELMRLMNVRIPYRLVENTCVLLSVDGILYGIFNLSYKADHKVRGALVRLMSSSRHPIFAIRDFNVTPDMLRQSFDIATDGYDFPPYVERYEISSVQPSENSKIAAVVCREGLGPLAEMADAGRKMYVSVRVGLMLTLIGALIGMLMVFLRFLIAGSVPFGIIFGYMLLWIVPVLFSAILVS